MNSGNNPYWIAIACAQPIGMPTGCGHALRPKRIDASSSVHHNMVSITATVPARNSGRCGAAASRRGISAGNAWVCVVADMNKVYAESIGIMLRAGPQVNDAGQVMERQAPGVAPPYRRTSPSVRPHGIIG